VRWLSGQEHGATGTGYAGFDEGTRRRVSCAPFSVRDWQVVVRISL